MNQIQAKWSISDQAACFYLSVCFHLIFLPSPTMRTSFSLFQQKLLDPGNTVVLSNKNPLKTELFESVLKETCKTRKYIS